MWSCVPGKSSLKCFAESFNLAPSKSPHFSLCKTHQKKERKKGRKPHGSKKGFVWAWFRKALFNSLGSPHGGVKGQTHVTASSTKAQRHKDREGPQNHPDQQDPYMGKVQASSSRTSAGWRAKGCAWIFQAGWPGSANQPINQSDSPRAL